MSAPLRSSFPNNQNIPSDQPKWVNPCGLPGHVFDPDRDMKNAPVIPIDDLYTNIYRTATYANSQTTKIKHEFVQKEFDDESFEEGVSSYRQDWLPEIPKATMDHFSTITARIGTMAFDKLIERTLCVRDTRGYFGDAHLNRPTVKRHANHTGLSLAVLFGLALILSCTKTTWAVPVTGTLSRVSRDVEEDNSSNSVQATTQQFASELRSPCANNHPSSESSLLGAFNEKSLTEGRYQWARFIREQVSILRQLTKQYIPSWQQCRNTALVVLDTIPTAETIQNMSLVAATEKEYELLVLHATHMYFMLTQQSSAVEDCSPLRSNEVKLAETYRIMSFHLKANMCNFRILSEAYKISPNFQRATDQGLAKAHLANYQTCSKRVIRDCQVLKSTDVFLESFDHLLVQFTTNQTSSGSR